MSDEKIVYNVMDLKQLFGIGKQQAYDLANSGEFPIIKIGKRILIPKDDFHEWFNAKGVTKQ